MPKYDGIRSYISVLNRTHRQLYKSLTILVLQLIFVYNINQLKNYIYLVKHSNQSRRVEVTSERLENQIQGLSSASLLPGLSTSPIQCSPVPGSQKVSFFLLFHFNFLHLPRSQQYVVYISQKLYFVFSFLLLMYTTILLQFLFLKFLVWNYVFFLSIQLLCTTLFSFYFFVL